MSGTRLARTGRCRFLVCFGILILMVGMVAIFHSSQIQLDDIRQQRLHCEQQQEALNERLTNLVEQKYHLEKNQERERGEQLEIRSVLEQKVKKLEDQIQKNHIEQQLRYDKLKQSYTILQNEHRNLNEETQKVNKQQLDSINGLQTKLQTLKLELEKEKSNELGELLECREKYNIAENERKRLSNENQEVNVRLKEFKRVVEDYRFHCEYKLKEDFRKPGELKPDMTNQSTSEKSFQHQESVSEGVYHIYVNISNKKSKPTNDGLTTSIYEPLYGHKSVKEASLLSLQSPLNTKNDTKPLATKYFNGSLILNSVENFQIVPKPIKHINDKEQKQHNDKTKVAPLSAPKNQNQLTSKSKQPKRAASLTNTTPVNIKSSTGSISNLPPLALPPNQRKLPDNVAPVPEIFEDLLQKSIIEDRKSNDTPAQLHENIKHDLNERKVEKAAINNNDDSSAHEIKDGMGEDDSNILQHDDALNNFFDNDQEIVGHNEHKTKVQVDGKDNDDNDDLGRDNDEAGSIMSGVAAGDIVVKHKQQLLDDNLRNEVADDQGKEFGDGLRLDETVMEEDDDDDYSNPLSRKKAGGQAIRN